MGKLLDVHAMARRAEEFGIIDRPDVCQTCFQPKELVRHHRDYDEPLEITWLCRSCHRQEHGRNKYLRDPRNDGRRKPVQIDKNTHSIIKQEALRQSMKFGCHVTMGGVISQLAIQLTKKRRRK